MRDARYIDPDTQGYVTERGGYRRISAAAAWAYLALMTRRGSVPGLPSFGSGLRDLTHVRPGITGEIERCIDEVMKPEVGLRFRDYRRSAWLAHGIPYWQVTIYGWDDLPQVMTVPWSA